MGLPGAFMDVARKDHGVRSSDEAVRDFNDIVVGLSLEEQCRQASRCMNCGVPFCQSGLQFNGARQPTGCPLHNLVPETNDLLFRGRWDQAVRRLSLTNPFPEFTGRVCPAPCETACNLGLHDDAVTIHDNERALSDYAWEKGMEPLPKASGRAPLVSVVGSGPAGLAAAWELARRGLRVRVYERDERPGGLLMYGIPNMKLPKWVVERRCELMRQSGIEFRCGVDAVPQAADIAGESAAVVLACGAREARRVDVPGADLDGVHFAVEYLSEATRSLLDGREASITAKGKDIAVIGGGDTGVDCVATALRQGARTVRQIIRAPRPSADADAFGSWPGPRGVYSQAYGQREAEDVLGEDPRLWSRETVRFADDGAGAVAAVCTRAISASDGGEEKTPAQLVLIAKGFIGPEQGTVEAFAGFSNVYRAGDARLGATLVASAMADAIEIAAQVARDVAPASC